MTTCARCKSNLPITYYAMSRKGKSTPLRCTQCGAVHSHLDGELTVISPRMMPISSDSARVSPWMLPRSRPLEVGVYHVRFRDVTNVEYLTLWWNGRNFQVSDMDNRPVSTRTLLTWRGEWAQ